MGYYAHGNGLLKIKKDIKVPTSVFANLGKEFTEVADAPDGGLYLTFEYDRYHEDDVQNALRNIAPYVEDGNVDFVGDDESKWRFYFCNGEMHEQIGRTVYEEVDAGWRHSKREKLIETFVDVVEDWLKWRGITKEDIRGKDIDYDPDENDAIIIGIDYATLADNFEEILIKNELIEEE